MNTFKRIGFIWFTAILLAFTSPHHAVAETVTTADLTGHVTLPGDNPTGAIVLVQTAESKSPLNTYPDVPRHVQTDRHGDFIVKSLDGRWRYNGYVVAPGCQVGKFTSVDPTAGPLNIALKPTRTANAPPGTVLRGCIVDPNDRPIEGALIHIHEVTRDGTMYFGNDGVDPYSVSDEAGNFVVYGKRPFSDAGGDVQSPGFALGLFERWTSVGAPNAEDIPGFATGPSPSFSAGGEPHQLTLVEGASVQGRLLDEGKPVANAKILLNGTEAASWIWNYTAITDEQGRFVFSHLPPDGNGRLQGPTGELLADGVIPVESVPIHQNGSTNDLGDIHLLPALAIDGCIHLSDGKSIPKNSFVDFGNFSIGMSPRFGVDENGSFHLTGIPAGTLTLYLRIPGYELTPRDHLLISGSATNINIGSNLKHFEITMEPSRLNARRDL